MKFVILVGTCYIFSGFNCICSPTRLLLLLFSLVILKHSAKPVNTLNTREEYVWGKNSLTRLLLSKQNSAANVVYLHKSIIF